MEDRRGQGGFGGGGIPIPIGTGAGGLGVILAVVLALVFGGNIFGGGDGGGLSPGSGLQPAPPADQGSTPREGRGHAVRVHEVREQGRAGHVDADLRKSRARQYARAPVVAFTSGTQTGCGPASSATGPFYCPADNKVYLDLSFYQELSRRFGAPGDFAWAYVVAHEIGHHVQTVLGIEGNVRRTAAERSGEREPLPRAARAPGRLLRRCLGALHVRARRARAGRRRRGAPRRSRRRRRPARGEEPGAVDARLLGASHRVVPPGLRVRQPGRLRHERRPGLSGAAAALARLVAPDLSQRPNPVKTLVRTRL